MGPMTEKQEELYQRIDRSRTRTASLPPQAQNQDEVEVANEEDSTKDSTKAESTVASSKEKKRLVPTLVTDNKNNTANEDEGNLAKAFGMNPDGPKMRCYSAGIAFVYEQEGYPENPEDDPLSPAFRDPLLRDPPSDDSVSNDSDKSDFDDDVCAYCSQPGGLMQCHREWGGAIIVGCGCTQIVLD